MKKILWVIATIAIGCCIWYCYSQFYDNKPSEILYIDEKHICHIDAYCCESPHIVTYKEFFMPKDKFKKGNLETSPFCGKCISGKDLQELDECKRTARRFNKKSEELFWWLHAEGQYKGELDAFRHEIQILENQQDVFRWIEKRNEQRFGNSFEEFKALFTYSLIKEEDIERDGSEIMFILYSANNEKYLIPRFKEKKFLKHFPDAKVEDKARQEEEDKN